MNESDISDEREIMDFKGLTISKYKKGDVKQVPNFRSNKLRVSTTSCVEFINLRSVCFIKSRKVSELSKILPKLYEHNWKTNDFLVINYGLHLNSTPKSAIRKAFSDNMHNFVNTRGEVALVWRETSPQHFKNPGGAFTRDKLKS